MVIVIKKLYYRGIWRNRKSKNFHISEITFHTIAFSTYCLSQALSSLFIDSIKNLNAKYYVSVYTFPPGNHLKWSFQKKSLYHTMYEICIKSKDNKFKKSIIRPNKSLCERQTSLVKNYILYYAWQKWSCGDTRFDICG